MIIYSFDNRILQVLKEMVTFSKELYPKSNDKYINSLFESFSKSIYQL
jgi:hypothetical protein